MIEHACIVSSATGEILGKFFNVSEGTLKDNTPEDSIVIYERIPNEEAYWDFISETFKLIGQAPSIHHVFDYAFKQWVDPRTLDEIKNQKWQEIKKHRDALEFGGFVFDGGLYDSDQASQGRIMGASIAGIDQVWTLADNTTRLLTAIQLQQLYAALQTHIAVAHERGRIARQLIYEATSKEQIDAIQL